MDDLKISSGSWNDKNDIELDNFSTAAALVISDAVHYPQMATEALALTEASETYHFANSRYQQFGGLDNENDKDAAKTVLVEAHAAAAVKLEATANGDRIYLTRPGYTLVRQRGGRSTAQVAAPIVRKVESFGVRGRVKVMLNAEKPTEIKGVLGRYSDDDGITWTEGIIAFKLNFVLDGQPSGQTRLYQFKFTATSGRTSELSASVRVEVF